MLQKGTYVDSDVELSAIATVLQTHIKLLYRAPNDTGLDTVEETQITPRITLDHTHANQITLVHYPGAPGH